MLFPSVAEWDFDQKRTEQNIVAIRRFKQTDYKVRAKELQDNLRRSQARVSNLTKMVKRMKVCFCIDKTRNCFYCQTPFDPSWSHVPSIERFCDDHCKREYRRIFG